MTLCVNQSGTWREITTQCVKQSSTWREVVTGCINQSGTWREFGFLAAYEGGYLICQASSVQWIVSPYSTEVSRNWYCRDDAVTTAQANAACGDWFVPTIGQLRDPGYTCRTCWDSYSSTNYRSSSQFNSSSAWLKHFGNGFTGNGPSKTNVYCVRAFRCVSY